MSIFSGQHAMLAEEVDSRTILVTELAPPAMRKRDTWRIDQFHLQKKIGSGYASSVYLATCSLSGVQVAIKMYNKNKLTDLNVFQVFREIRIHSKLDHKNIIQLWAAFEDQYAIYLVSEYASQGDVFANVEQRGGCMTESETVQQVLFPFLQALVYLHDLKIMHRDIKPENLLFTHAGVLKVADFGLSLEFDKEHPVTRVGTLDYMAPEVVVCPDKQLPEDNKEVRHLRYTPVVDSWAVGVLAYELCVGQPPFDRGHKKLTITEILNGDPQIPLHLSDEAASFIRWALTKNRHMRPTVQRLIEHPWIVTQVQQRTRVRQAVRAFGRHMRSVESYVEPRSCRIQSVEQQSMLAGLEATVRDIQAKEVQHRGRMLGHSYSLNAKDMMRWRDVAFNADPTGTHFQQLVEAVAPKRRSDCGQDQASPLSRRQSFAMAAGMLGMGSPMAAALAAAATFVDQSTEFARVSGGLRTRAGLPALPPEHTMSRQEIMASLQASADKFNRQLSCGASWGTVSPTKIASTAPGTTSFLSRSPAPNSTSLPEMISRGPFPSLSAPPVPSSPHAPSHSTTPSPRAVRSQLRSHPSLKQSSTLPPRAPLLPHGSVSFKYDYRQMAGSAAETEGRPRLSSEQLPARPVSSDREQSPQPTSGKVHKPAPVTVMRSITEPMTLNFAFRPTPPVLPPSHMPFAFGPGRAPGVSSADMANAPANGFMPSSPSKDASSPHYRIHRLPRIVPMASTLPERLEEHPSQEQPVPDLATPESTGCQSAARTEVVGSRESSFECSRQAGAVAPHSPSTPTPTSKQPKPKQKEKEGPLSGDNASVPLLLQSAKEILGGLRKVFVSSS